MSYSNLDLQSKLLLNRKENDKKKYQFPKIEIISSQTTDTPTTAIESATETEIEEDISLSSSSIFHSFLSPKYGFNSQYSGVLRNYREEAVAMLSLPSPDDIPLTQRRELRQKLEENSFDSDRYVGDYLEGDKDMIYTESMKYTPYWEEMWNKKKNEKKNTTDQESKTDKEREYENDGIIFTEEEKETMRRLPQK